VYKLIIKPEAELDLEEAFQWYEEQRSGLGREFLECVEQVFDRIREMPGAGSPVNGNARLTLVRRFPYVVCYLVEEDTVHVAAVFHGHREPKTWQHRLS